MEWDLESVDRYTDTVVKSHAPDLKIPPEMCIVEAPVEPCTIVILGATGDLTSRKLAPALYHLHLNGGLPESFAILGAARSEMSREQFQERIKQSAAGMDMSGWPQFAQSLLVAPPARVQCPFTLKLRCHLSFQSSLSPTCRAEASKNNWFTNPL